jgi:hypothetical protein
MTCGFEEDRCTPLGAVALLYPLPRCRRPSQAVQIRSAANLSSVAEELSPAGQPSGRRWICPLSHLWSLSDGASVRPHPLLQLFGYRYNQLPRLIEQSSQWLSGPSPPLPVRRTARRLPYRIQIMFWRAAHFYSTIDIGWHKMHKAVEAWKQKRSV